MAARVERGLAGRRGAATAPSPRRAIAKRMPASRKTGKTMTSAFEKPT